MLKKNIRQIFTEVKLLRKNIFYFLAIIESNRLQIYTSQFYQVFFTLLDLKILDVVYILPYQCEVN